MPSRSLIIGANGFLGKPLAEALALKGGHVRAFDRYRNGAPSFESRNIEVCLGDFRNKEDLELALDDVDQVFHFLSLSTPLTAERDPAFDVRDNVLRTVELLELCVKKRVSRVFFASSGGAIYGDQGEKSYSEKSLALPVSPYAIGKLSIEGYLRFFKKKFSLDSVSLRISNPYGSGQPEDRVQGFIPIMLRKIAAGEPAVCFGDGSMVRDFIFIDDVIKMIVQLEQTTPRWDCYNLGSGIGSSVAEVIKAAKLITGIDFPVTFEPMPPSFVHRTVLDITRYRDEFGSEAVTPLIDGMRKTWNSIREIS